VLADVALTMIGSLPGGQFTRKELHEHGRAVLMIAIAESVGALELLKAGAGSVCSQRQRCRAWWW